MPVEIRANIIEYVVLFPAVTSITIPPFRNRRGFRELKAHTRDLDAPLRVRPFITDGLVSEPGSSAVRFGTVNQVFAPSK